MEHDLADLYKRYELSVNTKACRSTLQGDNICIQQGGTSSGKTFGILHALIILAKANPNTLTTVVGQDMPNLKAGAIRDFDNILSAYPFIRKRIAEVNKTDKIYYWHNKSIAEFKAYDNAQDAKNGKRDFLFVNEANGVPYPVFFELYIRTTRQTIIDYNPTAKFWAHDLQNFFKDVKVARYITTYKDNPFLADEIRRKVEAFEHTDPERWRVYGLGLTGKVSGLIFKSYTTANEVPENAKLIGYGLDFGYTNDPTALIAAYQYDGRRYFKEIIYGTHYQNIQLVELMRANGIKSSDTIVADNAEPKSIDYLSQHGFNVYPCVKGEDSVRNGIDVIKEMPIVTVQSPNINKELDNYSWLQTKDGTFLNKPEDRNNHAIDAIRYILTHKEKRIGIIDY